MNADARKIRFIVFMLIAALTIGALVSSFRAHGATAQQKEKINAEV